MHQAWDLFLCYNKVKLSEGSPRTSPESFFYFSLDLTLLHKELPSYPPSRLKLFLPPRANGQKAQKML